MLKPSFIIIGGGIVGHMIAWKICHAWPGAAVTLLERDMIGCGATLRSAGLHFPLGRTAAVRAMSERSEAFYREFRTSQPDAPIVSLGLRVHAGQSGAADLAKIFTSGAALELDRAGCSVSAVFGSRHGIWRASGAQRADVTALTQYLGERLRDRVRCLTGLKVTRIVEKGATARVLTQDGQTLSADTIVLAPGPWALAPEFLPFTESLGIRIKRVVAFHIDRSATAELQSDAAVDLFVDEDAFLMPRPRGMGRLFSFTRQHWDVEPAASTGDLCAEDRAEGTAILQSVAPRLAHAIAGGQLFCDAYSPDRIPIVARVGQSGRVIFAGAANGSGYRLAPAIAHEVLGAVAAEHTEEISA